MGFIDGLNRIIGVYFASLKQGGKLKIWYPFLLYFVLQFVLLLVMKNYTNPIIYTIIGPFIALFGETRAELFSHYPGLYLFLPYFFQWGKIALGVIFEGLAIGLTTILFLKAYVPQKYTDLKLSVALSQWPQLLACWTLITGILFIINWFVPQLLEEQLYGSPRRQMIYEFVMRLITVGIYSIFIYAVPAIIVYGTNTIKAIKTSFGLFINYPFFSFFLGLIAFAMTIPASYLSGKSEIVVSRFSPELMFYILAFGLIIDVIVNIFFTGAIVRFILDEND